MKKYILFATTFLFTIPIITNAATLNIESLTPNANVPAGTTITFQLTTPTIINPAYTLSDSSPGSTLSNSNINIYGKFTWNTSVLDIGTHNITVNASDIYGNRGTLNQTLIISTSTPISIQDLAPGTNVFADKTLSFNIIAQGYDNPNFSVTDSVWDSSFSNNNIDSNGRVSWTPTQKDIGVHNLAIRVSTAGRSDTIYQTVTVNGILIPNNLTKTLPVGSSLNFTIIPYGLTTGINIPSYRITDTAGNNTIENAGIIINNFSWTPQVQDIGNHTISISTNDLNGTPVTSKINVTVTSNVVNVTKPVETVIKDIKYIFAKSLNVGSTGSEVSELQKRLKADGFYSGPITNYYGALTKAAVIKFQKANKISPFGNVGPATRSALNKN